MLSVYCIIESILKMNIGDSDLYFEEFRNYFIWREVKEWFNLKALFIGR